MHVYKNISKRQRIYFNSKLNSDIHTAAERDGQIAELHEVVAERDRALAEIRGSLNAIQNSKTWRFGRMFSKILRILLPKEK